MSTKVGRKIFGVDLVDLTVNPVEGIVAGPLQEDNFFEWEAMILWVHSLLILKRFRGPEDTPFENGVFTAKMTFPADYPLNPPKMVFTSKMWHPNSISWLSLWLTFQFIPMVKCAYQFYTLLEMTLICTSPVLNVGPQCNLLKRFCYLWCQCWLNPTVRALPTLRHQ